jgi:hypothetical protein
MTMMSPGRAGSPEEGRRDGAPERPDVLLGIFVVACLRVTFVDVPVLAVALLEAVLLTAVFFAVAFFALALLAVVLFVGTFLASPTAVTSCSLRLRREGRRTGPVVIVLKGPSR